MDFVPLVLTMNKRFYNVNIFPQMCLLYISIHSVEQGKYLSHISMVLEVQEANDIKYFKPHFNGIGGARS